MASLSGTSRSESSVKDLGGLKSLRTGGTGKRRVRVDKVVSKSMSCPCFWTFHRRLSNSGPFSQRAAIPLMSQHHDHCLDLSLRPLPPERKPPSLNWQNMTRVSIPALRMGLVAHLTLVCRNGQGFTRERVIQTHENKNRSRFQHVSTS